MKNNFAFPHFCSDAGRWHKANNDKHPQLIKGNMEFCVNYFYEMNNSFQNRMWNKLLNSTIPTLNNQEIRKEV